MSTPSLPFLNIDLTCQHPLFHFCCRQCAESVCIRTTQGVQACVVPNMSARHPRTLSSTWPSSMWPSATCWHIFLQGTSQITTHAQRVWLKRGLFVKMAPHSRYKWQNQSSSRYGKPLAWFPHTHHTTQMVPSNSPFLGDSTAIELTRILLHNSTVTLLLF